MQAQYSFYSAPGSRLSHTAWFLRQRGFEVTVVDRQPGPALETSLPTARYRSVGLDPWASHACAIQILKWLGQEDARCCSV